MEKARRKELRRPTTGLYPVPVVMVTCADESGRPNIITLAWVGVVCSEPPQIGISVRPHRYSYGLIERGGEFVVNIPSEDLLYATDLCGILSGQDGDKFERVGLTPEPATQVKPPLISECPVNLECVVRHKLPLGSHDLFIGEVVAVHMASAILDENRRIDFAKARPFTYNYREYRGLGKLLNRHGFSAPRKEEE